MDMYLSGTIIDNCPALSTTKNQQQQLQKINSEALLLVTP